VANLHFDGCHFCSKVREQVRLLIEAPDGKRICNECAVGAKQILDEQAVKERAEADKLKHTDASKPTPTIGRVLRFADYADRGIVA
jgi:ATP-dependent protease Clp ATPase subunit